ncbi:MAG TPA: hypothetical protein VMH77_04010 [Steroidobacteraceae bacterium]|nr:hypothetical protein [Steroidobacteraceae bacterium]
MPLVQSAHNLRRPHSEEPAPYGVRISLRADDPFRKLLGPDWHRLHWYRTAEERDAALLEMSRRHEYSRPKDRPTLLFSKVENLAASRGLA